MHTLTAQSNVLECLPNAFSNLKNLATIDLSKNKLKGVNLSNLPALRFVDLRQNSIDQFPQLPEGSQLDQLLLGYNCISSIPDETLLLVANSLSVLSIRDNKLVELPRAICLFHHLKTLDLTNNDLSDLPPGIFT